MTLSDLWFLIIAVLWTGYFVLEGFDLGVGVLHRWIGSDDTERRLAVNSIGPFWDGNEVWLIVGGAGIFAAFPAWYATWFSAGYLALVLLLVALIVRGLSFEWRTKMTTSRWRDTWSWALTVGSLVIPVLLGVALGDLLAGLPVDSDGNFTGGFIDLLTPYGLLTGVTLLVLCVLHGATFLGLRTDGPVRHRARAVAGRLVWVALLLVAGLAVWTAVISDAPVWARALSAVPVLGAVGAALALRASREGWSFVGTAVTVGGVIAALFAALYPDVLVSSTDPASTLTISSAAAGDYALKVMTVVALVLFPIVLLYQGWTYWVFRARLRPVDPAEPSDRKESLPST